MNQKKNIHNGHRERLLDLIEKNGMENVTDIQAIEFFLTFFIPRVDVNPLAHRLIDKFDNLINIVNADVKDLTSVEGINIKSARKIKAFYKIMMYYNLLDISNNTDIKNLGEFANKLKNLLGKCPTENLLLFALNNSYKVTHTRVYNLIDVRNVGIKTQELFSFINSTNLCYLAIAHNHPGGTALPSQEDEDAVKYIEEMIKPWKIDLIDSFILGEDGIYSQAQDDFIERFDKK